MRNKPDLDTMSMDDLYKNLKVYKAEIKSQSSSSSQNMAFVSSESTSSTNEAVNTAHEVSTANSQGQASSSSYADDVIDGSQMAGGDAYHESEEILKEDTKESKLQWKKLLALIRQRLNVTTDIAEVTLLKNAGHQGIRGIEMEMFLEELYQ
ncbi:hypothetical protein Tco_1099112 [Tanacetum coccineum]